MKLKFIVIASTWIFIQIILVACCPDPLYDYTRIDSYEIGNGKWDNVHLADSSTVSSEDFRIILEIRRSFIAESIISQTLMNSCYALTCEDDGGKGLKIRLQKIEITSLQSFVGMAAGELLNNLFDAHGTGFYDESKHQKISIEEMLSEINTKNNTRSTYYLELKDKNISSTVNSFKITLIFEDGTTMSSNTNTIKIE